MHHPEPDERPAPHWLGPTRIGIGLVQGLLLYLLYTASQDKLWPATVPMLFAPLVLAGVLVPIILINGLDHLRRRKLLLWTCAAIAIVALLGVYDIWRRADGGPAPHMPSGVLSFCLGVGFFIAHALVLAGARERRRIAAYATYFDVAWKLNLQIVFCFLFVGATWLVLQLGAALFDLVKLDFLSRAMRRAWFSIPVTTFAFACAMHLTDVKPAIVRGIRNLLHMLLAWILPVLTLLVGGFLASLPFTGLEPLWATRSAAGILLGSAGAFVILINAAWQDGAERPARVIALSARIASLLLVPLTLLAAHALFLRVDSHGWTHDRIIAAACLLVAACYAGGYAAAAVRRGWLATLSGVNVAAAFVVLGVLLVLFSPLGDPGRIATNSQMARLAAGRITLQQLDVAYLYHHGARYGRDAIGRLERSVTGKDAGWLKVELARLRQPQDFDAGHAPAQLADNLRVWPAGTALPVGFASVDFTQVQHQYRLPLCLRRQGTVCDAFVLDLGGDARPEVVLVGAANHGNAVLRQGDKGDWQFAGSLPAALAGCTQLLDAMRAGALRAAPPALADLEVGGQRIAVEPGFVRWECPDAPPRQGKPNNTGAGEGRAARD